MAKSAEPIVLELASLPREQAGPFLLLGLPKAADRREAEAHWADRIKWARKQIIKVPLEDVNWARDALGDVQRRIRADAASLNTDLAEETLRRLAVSYGQQAGQAGRMWQPLDAEKPLADYSPPAEVPDAAAVRAALTVPPVPEELPAVAALVQALAGQPLDPWALELPCPGGASSPLSQP